MPRNGCSAKGRNGRAIGGAASGIWLRLFADRPDSDRPGRRRSESGKALLRQLRLVAYEAMQERHLVGRRGELCVDHPGLARLQRGHRTRGAGPGLAIAARAAELGDRAARNEHRVGDGDREGGRDGAGIPHHDGEVAAHIVGELRQLAGPGLQLQHRRRVEWLRVKRSSHRGRRTTQQHGNCCQP